MNFDKKDRVTFKKLGTGGDFYSWSNRIETHFRVLNLWEHVIDNQPIEIADDANETAEQKAARAKRDLFLSLHDDLLLTVSHLQTANEIYTEVKRLFIGSETAERRKLLEKLHGLYFSGNYFSFMVNFKVYVQRLNQLGAINSFKDITFLFLDRLPKEHLQLVYGLRSSIEEEEADQENIFSRVYEAVLEYLIEAKLYDVSARQSIENRPKKDQKPSMMKAAVQNKSKQQRYKGKSHPKCEKCGLKHAEGKDCPECYGCGKTGHFKRDCKESSEGKAAQSGGRAKAFMSLVNSEYQDIKDTDFLLDSGATYHCCGLSELFLRRIELNKPLSIATANGIVWATHMGSVGITLDNGEAVELHNVLYWENAPNLLSVRRLNAKNCSVQFARGQASILLPDGTVFYEAKVDEDGITTVGIQTGGEQSKSKDLYCFTAFHLA